jgi:biofilm PGA synthesis N-glycosyltransferase PgaC
LGDDGLELTNIKYVVVTPVRDEEAYLRLTIESMIAQTIRPREWIIVDDGSKDGTLRIIEEYSRQHPWIRGVRRNDRGFRKPGGGIIEAFYAGFSELGCNDWDFMAKLDGDLFHLLENGERELEWVPQFHVRGGAKIYRRACWDAIGGLWVGLGSDTVDEVKANMLGWSSMSFPDLLVHHHRFTGANYGRWGGVVKNGKANYVCGYHPVFMAAKCVTRLKRKPYVVGALGLFYGFVSGYFERIPRVNDPDLIKYLRRQQINLLLCRETIWK